MNRMNGTPAFTTPRFDLQLLDTAKHRAATLRQAAINDALDQAAAAPVTWWRKLRQAFASSLRPA